MNQAEDFVAAFARGVGLKKAQGGKLKEIDDLASDDFLILIFQDGSRAGYKRGNNRAKSQAWPISAIE